jgi:hypothetical protein
MDSQQKKLLEALASDLLAKLDNAIAQRYGKGLPETGLHSWHEALMQLIIDGHKVLSDR